MAFKTATDTADVRVYADRSGAIVVTDLTHIATTDAPGVHRTEDWIGF